MLPLLIPAIAQAGVGIYQAATSGAAGAQKDFENFSKISPLAKESKSLNDYYQQALNRYQENPYQSQQYQLGAMNAQRATAQGINALQDRRSAIGGIGRLAAGQNMAMQNLGAQAEAQRNARFGQLGQATQAKTAQDKYLFDINQMTPYNRQLQVKQMKSQAANERLNAGLNMIGGAASNYMLGSMYGGNANKAEKAANIPNLNSYSTPANIPNSANWGANNQYGLYNSTPNSFASANPSAFGTATGMFNKNPLAGKYSATKAFKPYGF